MTVMVPMVVDLHLDDSGEHWNAWTDETLEDGIIVPKGLANLQLVEKLAREHGPNWSNYVPEEWR